MKRSPKQWTASVAIPLFGAGLVLSQVILTFMHQSADPQIVTAGMGAVLYPLVHEITRKRDKP